MTDTNTGRPIFCALCRHQPRWTATGTNELAIIECYGCGVSVRDSNRAAAKETWNQIQHGLLTLAAIPDPRKVLRERLLRLITTRVDVSEGVLLNLVRPTASEDMKRELNYLEADCQIKSAYRENPRNRKRHVIYSIYE